MLPTCACVCVWGKAAANDGADMHAELENGSYFIIQHPNTPTSVHASASLLLCSSSPSIHHGPPLSSSQTAFKVFDPSRLKNGIQCLKWKNFDRLCSDINECDKDNGGCSELCVNTKGSRRCACGRGRLLSEDGLTCRGMDHLSVLHADNRMHLMFPPVLPHTETAGCHVNSGGCSHGCTTLQDTHQCHCPRGLELGEDRRTCQGEYVRRGGDAAIFTKRKTWSLKDFFGKI